MSLVSHPWSPGGNPPPQKDRFFLHHFSHSMRKMGRFLMPRGWRYRTFFCTVDKEEGSQIHDRKGGHPSSE
jgi:hypothetical protein